MELKFMNTPLCPVCQKVCKQLQKCMGSSCFAKTCGNRECIKQCRHITNLKKYGHISNLHATEENGKTIVQNIVEEKYGVSNISHLDEVKEKKRISCRENFGVDWPMQSDVVMNKSIKTVKERYNVDNYAKSDEFKTKFIKHLHTVRPDGLTNMEYRVKKANETSIKIHDGKHWFQTSNFKKMYKAIMMEKHGVDNYFASKEFDELMKSRGVRYTLEEEINKLSEYYRKVINVTAKSYRKYKSILETEYKRSRSYHLDHIVSIIDGYNNNIDPLIIGSIVNLQILDSKVNMSKNRNSWMEISELMNLYNNLKEEV